MSADLPFEILFNIIYILYTHLPCLYRLGTMYTNIMVIGI